MVLLSSRDGMVEAGAAMSLADYLALPDDTRCEIVDGVLRPMVRPSKLHRRVQRRLAAALEASIPRGLRVEEEEVVVLATDPPIARIPDVAVFDDGADPGGTTNNTPARLVRLVIEVESRSTRSADRSEKPTEYAGAGIESYWRVEVEPYVTVHVHRRVGDHYELVSTVGAGEWLVDAQLPWFAVAVDDLSRDPAG